MIEINENDNKRIWKHENYFKLFISHLSQNKELATQLKDSLLRYGITSFVAHEDIEPSKEWIAELLKGLFSADALIVLMKSDYEKSLWIMQEMGIAIGRDIPIIDLKYEENANPCGFRSNYQAFKYNKTENYIKKLLTETTLAEKISSLITEYKKYTHIYRKEYNHNFNGIYNDLYTNYLPIMPDLINDSKVLDLYITMIENSNGFDKSIELAKILPKINKKGLGKSHIERIIIAYIKNDQIHNCVYFSECKTKNFESKGLLQELLRITDTEFEIIKNFDEFRNIEEDNDLKKELKEKIDKWGIDEEFY